MPPRQGEVLRLAHHPTWAAVLKAAGGGRYFAVLAACGLLASQHRQWRRGMVDFAPNPACPWCHADDINLHMLTCVPDGRGIVHRQQSTLFDSLSSRRHRSAANTRE